jgi:prepilin-type N-terminal cleavage/methylation domain-containing protein
VLPSRRGAGFTLLELLAVMALLGLVLFFVVPRLDNISPKTRLRSAARKIGSTMELAQGQAIATGKEYVLAYDVSKGTFWIILPPPDDPNAAAAAPADPNTPPPPPPDVEHDPKPAVTTATPKAGSSGASTPAAPPAHGSTSYQNRETAFEDLVGDDIVISSISLPNQQESTSGVLYITFSSLGNEGSHSVCLKLKGSQASSSFDTSDSTLSVRFSALSRTVDFASEKLGWSTLSGQ